MADEISREALLIYLDNIRTLETIIYESENQYSIIEKKQKKHISDTTKEPAPPNPPSLTLLILCGIWSVFWIFIGKIISFIVLCKIFAYLIGILPLIFAIKAFIKSKKEYPVRLKQYEEKCQKYRDDAPLRKSKIDAQNKQIDKFNKKLSKTIFELKTDIASTKKLLNQAYSANIIPSQFRNIQGIYYLYDYLSTSNQSLSDALMQCNLEAIKQKLDEVINLQSKAIVQQAQANEKLFEQNQRILETAEATMNNTAIAAKYAQISAVNSELALKMQEKQLAYQRAKF